MHHSHSCQNYYCNVVHTNFSDVHVRYLLSPVRLSVVCRLSVCNARAPYTLHPSTESPVHDLMLSIQAVRGLPRLRTPGIDPCTISFSRQFPCFLRNVIYRMYRRSTLMTRNQSLNIDNTDGYLK